MTLISVESKRFPHAARCSELCFVTGTPRWRLLGVASLALTLREFPALQYQLFKLRKSLIIAGHTFLYPANDSYPAN